MKAYDPEAMENFRNQVTSEVQYCEDMYEALDGADALAVITEWSVFRMPDFDLIKSKLSQAAVFDGRNVYSVQEMEKLGFHYESIGR